MKQMHLLGHMKYLVPDSLNKEQVGEAQRQYNNIAQRVRAAETHFQRMAAREVQKAVPQTEATNQAMDEHTMKMQFRAEEHQQKLEFRQQDAEQRKAIHDTLAASKIRATTFAARLKGGTAAQRPVRPAVTTPSILSNPPQT